MNANTETTHRWQSLPHGIQELVRREQARRANAKQ